MKLQDELKREPTLFYLTRGSKENGPKFRAAVCLAISTLLDNSEIIQKWQGQLEHEKSEGKTCEPLGQFLRLLHYTVIVMVETETEMSMMMPQIKIANTLLH